MDFITDNNPKHINYVKSLLEEMPSYVKEANKIEKPRIARGSFADGANKEYPMDTSENTFLSYAYLKTAGVSALEQPKEANYNSIISKLENAAQIHGISDDLTNVSNKLETDSIEKRAKSAKENFALIIDFEKEGGLKYYYPINSREMVEKSARDLIQDEKKMPIEAFRTASNQILKKARSLKIPESSLPLKIRRTGADKDFNEKIANHAAKQRSKKFGEEAGKIYFEIVKSASQDKEALNNYVNLFVDMDRINKVEYGKNMLNPYEAFYSGVENSEIEKAAEAHILINDAPVPLDEFNEIAEKVVEEKFNKKEASELMPVVEAAQEGGVPATLKVMGLEADLQKRFLKALVEDK